MRTTSRNTLLVGISAILVLALVIPIQSAEAQEASTNILFKLQDIQSNIQTLKENTKDFNINKLGSTMFNFRTLGTELLDVQESQNIDADERLSGVIDYLITEYQQTYDKYENQLNKYEKNNALIMKQKQLINILKQNYIDFKLIDERHDQKLIKKEFSQSEMKKIHNEEKFQDFINKVAIKYIDAHNGNKVKKIYHELALEKILNEEKWDLSPAAMDRIINQYSNIDVKKHLINYKEQIVTTIEKLEKTSQYSKVFNLSHAEVETILFLGILDNGNDIHTPSIVDAQLKNKIKSVIEDSREIIESENQRIKDYLESQRIDSQEKDKQDSVEKKPSTQSEPEPEKVKKNGDGNSKGKGNSNGDGNSKGKGNSNGKGIN